jgi:WD40 repeat protein/serine/threonine protein kinase
MIIPGNCTRCGARLSGGLQGLCPKCLSSLAFGDDETEMSTAEDFLSPRRRDDGFGDYELIEEIARGGMGVVYKARQRSLNRIVALKMILAGPFAGAEYIQRFQAESQAAARLHHPNIVSIYEVGAEDGRHFFSMEYIEGQNLADLVRNQPLDGKRAARYVKTIAEAIHYAHQNGILHRDLKPSNVLIDTQDQPRITDFGLAKQLDDDDSNLTLTGQTLGSPNYMPPEQATASHAEVNLRSDVYSLGAVLYHLITGRPPFQGQSIPDVLQQVQNREPVPPRLLISGIDQDLETICLKCLQKDSQRRYSSAGGLADDLGRFLKGEPIIARPVGRPEQLFRWCKRNRELSISLAAVLLATIVGIAGVIWQWLRAESHAKAESEQRVLAEKHGSDLRVNLYAADISSAALAMERGDLDLARRLLSAHKPGQGQEDLRGFEWRYLSELCRGQALFTLNAHHWIVMCLAFSPDGQWLASGGQDPDVHLWNARTGAPAGTIRAHAGAVWSLQFTPDGRQLMTSGADHKIKFWNLTTKQPEASFDGQTAVLSKSGSLMAANESSLLYWEAAGKISIWDYHAKRKLLEIAEPGKSMAFSPDDKTLAVTGREKDIQLWDLETGARKKTLPTQAEVWSVSFSPDGHQLAAVGRETALLWNLAGSNQPVSLPGHSLTVWAASFSPDSKLLATAASDRAIRIWDTKTLQLKSVLRGHGNEVWAVEFSPDGKTLASAGKDKLVMLWPTQSSSTSAVVRDKVQFHPRFSPDGSKMLVWTPRASPPTSEVWDLKRGQKLASIGGDPDGFSSDGNSLVNFNEPTLTLDYNSISDTYVFQRRLALNPSRAQGDIVLSGLSPTSAFLFAITEDGGATVWHTGRGGIIGHVSGPKPPIRAAVLSKNGQRLAISTERENDVKVYDVVHGTERSLVGHSDFVSGIDFSPDGNLIATGGVDAQIKLWDAATAENIATLTGHMEEVTDLAFSPDGRTLASVGIKESVRLWHIASRRELLSIKMPLAGFCIGFSPDGEHLVVTSQDERLQILDAPRASQ